jgi:ABC-type phosphate transport system permease subunit
MLFFVLLVVDWLIYALLMASHRTFSQDANLNLIASDMWVDRKRLAIWLLFVGGFFTIIAVLVVVMPLADAARNLFGS